MPPTPRFLVIGTGSIGRRHINNISKLGYRCDAVSRTGKKKINDLPSSVRLVTLRENEDLNNYDAVILATATSEHVELAIEFAKKQKSLFIEKPLSHSLGRVDELRRLARKYRLVVEVGFMLRTHPDLKLIKRLIDENALGQVHYCRAVVGHDLRQWRKGSNHKESYSAKRGKGGGVLLDLSHEIDMLCWLFGLPTHAFGMESFDKSLGIETESCLHAQLRFAGNVLAQVSLDYLRRDYSRNLEIVCSRGTLIWDYVTSQVSIIAEGDVLENRVPKKLHFDRNEMFMNQMRIFASRIKSNEEPAVCDLDEAIKSQKVLQAIRDSITTNRAIRIPQTSNS